MIVREYRYDVEYNGVDYLKNTNPSTPDEYVAASMLAYLRINWCSRNRITCLSMLVLASGVDGSHREIPF